MTITPAQKRAAQRVSAHTLAVKMQAVREERDALVRTMNTEGWSLRDIAGAFGLSHAGVKKIVDRV